jgi:hypothetical protein
VGGWMKNDRRDKNQHESHQIQQNPSKDRAMYEGHNPSFSKWNYNIYIFLNSSILIRILKQVPKYFATELYIYPQGLTVH